jgi:alkyldihydroxyacetonephosphate synthase
VLLVLDEADAALLAATEAIVGEECAGAASLDRELVDRWLAHRNDVSALHALTEKGFVVDTMEIAAPWARLPGLFTSTVAALLAVEHSRVATAHLSHSCSDGACLYFTFRGHAAGRPSSPRTWPCGTPGSGPYWPGRVAQPPSRRSG